MEQGKLWAGGGGQAMRRLSAGLEATAGGACRGAPDKSLTAHMRGRLGLNILNIIKDFIFYSYMISRSISHTYKIGVIIYLCLVFLIFLQAQSV